MDGVVYQGEKEHALTAAHETDDVWGLSADPPFLFPHGYFDSSKLKPFDAIYLNLMAQSNLEYGGITLEELDKLAASHRYVPWPSYLPRTRVEDDVLLYRVPMSDTDGIAPGPKSNDSDHAPSRPFSTLVNEIISTSGGRASRGDVAALKTSRPSSSGFTLTAPEPGSPLAKPMRRIRRASDVDEENPFEDIATRAPPRDQMQLQLVRKMLRQSRHRKKKHRFLTRDDIYDPQRQESYCLLDDVDQ
ncbi:hypothetical protein RB195_001243 [Necator americanus]|uniref:Uncharacterized protein n=1 Tax=Necator americanus TaxID=51031 RepID=A0ABR1DE75_NECAM